MQPIHAGQPATTRVTSGRPARCGTPRPAVGAKRPRAPGPTVDPVERGQGTVEHVGLRRRSRCCSDWSRSAARRAAADPVGEPDPPAAPPPRATRSTSGRSRARCSAPLIAAAAPTIVLERDDEGIDARSRARTAAGDSAARRSGARAACCTCTSCTSRRGWCSSTGRTTPTRRPTTCRSSRCRAPTATTGRGSRSRSRRRADPGRARERPPRLERLGAVVGGAARRLGALRGRRSTAPRAATRTGCAAATSTSRATAGTAISASSRRALRAARGRPGRQARARVRPGRRRAVGEGGLARPGRRAHRAARLVAGCADLAARAWAIAVSAARAAAAVERAAGPL